MKTSTAHNPRHRRSLAQGFRATFGQVQAPRLGHKSLVAVGLAGLLVAGAASADWFVKDREAIEILEKIRDYIGKDPTTVNKNLENLNNRLAIKGDEFKAGDGSADNPTLVEPKESDDKLPTDKAKPTAATGVDMAKRCSSGTSATGIQAEQNKVCQEMYKTEIAKYRFSLEMYDLAKKRNEKLQAIVAERNALNEKDFGKMEENTNKLVAMTAQMDNDRDRYTAYMNAYDARMVHLQKSSDLLSKQAINGGGGSGGGLPDMLPGLAGAGALAIALRTAAETEERECTKRMQQAGVCS